uniref:Uncharacterized protein n=1 Tax=Parascaris equorum TaxID=6256 RepID=A0A914RWU1_PAREQ
LPVEIGVKEPSGSSITVNVADSDTIPDDTNTVPVASSNPSASFNAKSLQNGEPAADEQLPFEGGAQISFGSGMTVDAAAINSSVSKTTVIPAAPTINPPTHTSGGLSEPQTVPPGDQFRADNVISRGGGGNALLGSKFAEALPAQSLGRSQGQMFAGSPPLGSQQFPTNTESNENTRVRQFSAQQSVITQEPQPASDGDFSAHATNVPLEQFSSTQSPIVPSFSSIPVNDVHAGTVPVESPPAKFISVTTDFSEQQSGVNLDTQTPLSIPVKSADVDVASAHGSAPSTAVTPPKPLPPTAEQFPSTISASDGISDGLDDRVSQPINSFVPSPPSEGQMRSDIFQNPSNATANTNAEGLKMEYMGFRVVCLNLANQCYQFEIVECAYSMKFELQDTSIKNGESANDTMQHLTDSIEMPISNGTNASEVVNNLIVQLNERQVVTKTDVKVPESETTTGLQDSVKETTRRSTSDLKTEIIEEDGL